MHTNNAVFRRSGALFRAVDSMGAAIHDQWDQALALMQALWDSFQDEKAQLVSAAHAHAAASTAASSSPASLLGAAASQPQPQRHFPHHHQQHAHAQQRAQQVQMQARLAQLDKLLNTLEKYFRDTVSAAAVEKERFQSDVTAASQAVGDVSTLIVHHALELRQAFVYVRSACVDTRVMCARVMCVCACASIDVCVCVRVCVHVCVDRALRQAFTLCTYMRGHNRCAMGVCARVCMCVCVLDAGARSLKMRQNPRYFLLALCMIIERLEGFFVAFFNLNLNTHVHNANL